jgi:maltose O-acetyltransferase
MKTIETLRDEIGPLDPNPGRWFFLGLSRFLPRWRFGRMRSALYRRAGFQIGPRTVIMDALDVRGGGSRWQCRLSIGKGCLLTTGIRIVVDGKCRIGDRVTISPGATLHTGTHEIGPPSRRCHPDPIGKDIEIGDGAWICMNALILPGVRVGNGAVVAAGAVVTRDVPPNTLVAGNPAVVKRELPL